MVHRGEHVHTGQGVALFTPELKYIVHHIVKRPGMRRCVENLQVEGASRIPSFSVPPCMAAVYLFSRHPGTYINNLVPPIQATLPFLCDTCQL